MPTGIPKTLVIGVVTTVIILIIIYIFTQLPTGGVVFAALAAHGVATVCASPGARSAALEPGVHFLDAARLAGPVEPAALQTLASRAHGWYQGHRAARQSDLLAGRLGS